MAPIQKKSTPATRDLPRFSYSPANLRPLFAVVVNETTIVEHKLRIPKKCVKLFGEELSELSTFTVPHGNGCRAWKVRVVKNGKTKKKKSSSINNIWFKDGMEDFMDYYSIHLNSILQFTYQGNSMFSVRICDALGSEIDYPFVADDDDDGDDDDDDDEEEEEDDDGDEEEDDDDDDDDDDGDDEEDDDDYVCGSSKRRGFSSQKQPRKSPRRSVDSKSKDHNFKHFQTRNVSFIEEEDEEEDEEEEININNKNKFHVKQEVGEDENEIIVPRSFIYSKRRTVMSKRTKKVVQAALASKLNNPSFLVIVKRNMEVPVDFVRRHMKFCSERIQLQASNDQRKNWAVRCYYAHQDNPSVKRLGQGWGSFSSSQGLTTGDVCVFEMVRKVIDVVFRVWIYRAAEYA